MSPRRRRTRTRHRTRNPTNAIDDHTNALRSPRLSLSPAPRSSHSLALFPIHPCMSRTTTTDRVVHSFCRRVTARAPHRQSRSRVRGKEVARVRVDVSRVYTHRSHQRHLQYGGIWWYILIRRLMGDCAFTLRIVCPCLCPRVARRSTSSRALTWRLGDARMNACVRWVKNRRARVERELHTKTPLASFGGRSIAERDRTRRAFPGIHSFIHSFPFQRVVDRKR